MRHLSAAAAAALASLAALAALAGGAGAAPAARAAGGAVKLAIGDTIDVKGTRVACFAIVANKKPGIACVLWSKNAPLVGSYGVGLAVDGTVVLNQVMADGNPKTLLKRTPQLAARRSDKVYTGRPGDSFGLPIDKTHILGCRVIEVKPGQAALLYQGIKIACWRVTNELPVPNSNGVEISERYAAAYHFDAKGTVSGTLLVKRQP